MHLPKLIALLLLVACFGIAGHVEPRHGLWTGERRANALSMLIGDSRRLFANHFFSKADAYFHGGYYPTIFDGPKMEAKSHMEESTAEEHAGEETGHEEHDEHEKEAEQKPDEEHQEHEEHGGHEDADFLEEPKDWIEAFGRNFFPSEHVHMETAEEAREILPWLRLTAEMDPQKIETYTIAAYTLRNNLNRAGEAEEFLRDGWRANPDSYQILYELARLYKEQRDDPETARRLLELALEKWNRHAGKVAEPDYFSQAQLLIYLMKLEEERGNLEGMVIYLEQLKEHSPFRDQLIRQIENLREEIRKKK